MKSVGTLILTLLVQRISCYSVEVSSGGSECFSVTATTGMPCSGSFEVLADDPTPLSITVTGPSPHHESYHESKFSGQGALDSDQTEGVFNFEAKEEGDYTLCIKNGDENDHDGEDRLVAFTFRTSESAQRDYQYNGLDAELDELKMSLDLLVDHQSFMNQREDVHKRSLENMNMKVLFWTILEAVILVGMAIWQITYISKFFETKRRM